MLYYIRLQRQYTRIDSLNEQRGQYSHDRLKLSNEVKLTVDGREFHTLLTRFAKRCALKYKAPSTPATMSKQRSTLSKQHSTLLPKTATISNEFIVKFGPFDEVECYFDVVAANGTRTAVRFIYFIRMSIRVTVVDERRKNSSHVMSTRQKTILSHQIT